MPAHTPASRPYVDRPVTDLGRAERAARAAAIAWDLAEPELLRRGMNALFVAGDVVLRVGNATAAPELSHRLVDVLRAHGVPTVVPIDGLTGVFAERAVTGWERIEPCDEPIDWRAIGAAVRRVHELPIDAVPAGYPVPEPTRFPWWDFPVLLDEVGDDLDPPARAGIDAAIERYAPLLAELAAGAVVCHGDVHPGNVLVTRTGPLLIDWDLLCTANPAWDHAMLTTYATRWGGSAGTYEAFAGGYGASFVDDPITAAVAELRNVAATLMRVRAGRSDDAAATEAARRLRYWRGDPAAPAWRAQ